MPWFGSVWLESVCRVRNDTRRSTVARTRAGSISRRIARSSGSGSCRRTGWPGQRVPGTSGRASAASAVPAGRPASIAPAAVTATEPERRVRRLGVSDPLPEPCSVSCPPMSPVLRPAARIVEIAKTCDLYGMFGPVLPLLAQHHQVIAVDLQGHGRTADVDRPIDVRLIADDIAALIDHLELDAPDLVGYSLGGGVALHTAAKYPAEIRRLVVI